VKQIAPGDRVVIRRVPTAWQAVEYANLPEGEMVRELTDGRGPISVIDAVGMEAHSAPPVAKIAHKLTGMLPDALARPMMQNPGIDRLAALHTAIELVQRGGTISLDRPTGEHG
jgi:threonine dehydrogenase-like Zn-dependent dehydrogenase